MRPQKTFGESYGLWIRKTLAVLWFLLPLLVVSGILMAVASSSGDTPPSADTPLYDSAEETTTAEPLQLVNVKFRADSYYEHVDVTYFDLQLEFDRPVYTGYVTVAFFDANGTKTDEQELRLTPRSYGATDQFLSVTFADAKGNVVSCEIVDFSEIRYPSTAYADDDFDYGFHDEYDYDYDNLSKGIALVAILYEVVTIGLVWSFLRLVYVLPIVGTALFFNCKAYFIGGHYVTVYTGRFNHYVKVDGTKTDELSRLIPTSAPVLSTTVGATALDIRISPLTRHITLRADGVLQMPL